MRDLQEAANLIVGPPARSLRDVCPHGSGRATQLTRQSIRLLPWKLTSRIVDVQSHLVSFLPYNQFFVVLHSSCSSLKAHCSSLVAHCSLLIAQKLFTKFFPGICRTLPFNSSSNSAAKISEEDISFSNFSTISSMCVDSSAFSRLRIRFS